MDAKCLIILLIAINCYSSCGAALRRTPKVYNALITTDENLTSSRAYPVIQPTIHESGIAHYPFGPYNPYGFYSPPLVRFGQPIAPGLTPREQLPYPLPAAQFPPQIISRPPPHAQPPQPFPGYPLPQNPTESQQPQEAASTQHQQQEQQAPVMQPANSLPPQSQAPNYMPFVENRPQQMPNEKLPIPLNEFGLPPALIPLQQYPNRRTSHPVNLPPYGYNQFPLIYDPITGYREQYLPPYEYFPSHTYAVNAFPPKKQQTALPHAATATTTLPTPASEEDTDVTETVNSFEVTEAADAPDFESIKNGSKSKNSAVPDVPPPPIPSGAKSKQS